MRREPRIVLETEAAHRPGRSTRARRGATPRHSASAAAGSLQIVVAATSIIQCVAIKRRSRSYRLASGNLKEFTDQNFESEVLKSSEPVLVDFWAEWCPPCKALTPTIEKLADAYVGKVKIGKVDTDSAREVAMKYKISSIPTVLLFKNGQVAQTIVGLRNERDYRAALDANV